MRETLYYYRVKYMFQSEFTLYSCLNVKELHAQDKRNVLSLSDSNDIWTYNHLVRKRRLNHLAKLADHSANLVVVGSIPIDYRYFSEYFRWTKTKHTKGWFYEKKG